MLYILQLSSARLATLITRGPHQSISYDLGACGLYLALFFLNASSAFPQRRRTKVKSTSNLRGISSVTPKPMVTRRRPSKEHPGRVNIVLCIWQDQQCRYHEKGGQRSGLVLQSLLFKYPSVRLVSLIQELARLSKISYGRSNTSR